MLKKIRNYKTAILVLIAGILPLVVRYRIVKLIGGDSVSFSSNNILYTYNLFDAHKASALIISGAFLVALMLAENFYDSKKLRLRPSLWIPLITYVAFLFLSTALSDFPYNAVWGFTNRMEGFLVLLSYIILFVAAYSFASEKNTFTSSLRQLEGFLIFGAAVISIIGLLQLWGADPFTWKIFYKALVPDHMREYMPFVESKFINTAYTTLSNPNYVGSYCSLVLTFFMVRFLGRHEKGKRKVLYGLSIFLLASLLIGSHSRAGMLGIAFAMGAVLVFDIRNFKHRYKDWVALAAIIFSAALFLEVTTGGFVSAWIVAMGGRFQWFRNTFPLIFAENGMDNEDVLNMGSGRMLIWKLTLPMMKETFFMGNGPDTFLFHYPQAKYMEMGGKAFVAKPHNLYMQIFVNIGGPALLAFLGLVCGIFKRSFASLREKTISSPAAPFAAAIAAYMATGLFNDSVVSSAPIFWIFLGILVAMAER